MSQENMVTLFAINNAIMDGGSTDFQISSDGSDTKDTNKGFRPLSVPFLICTSGIPNGQLKVKIGVGLWQGKAELL